MSSSVGWRRTKPAHGKKSPPDNRLNRWVENDLIRRISLPEYRSWVRKVYDGPQGALLTTMSTLSLHLALGERLLRTRQFDLRGMRQILDAGCGAGQIARHLLKYSDPEAEITCFDLSATMLRRARKRIKSTRPNYLIADLARLPFADNTFDGITSGYVLEHLPDPRLGLSELRRVLQPGGKIMLLTSEDSFAGACTSRVWGCRTYNRQFLRKVCEEVDLVWHKDLWFTRMHRWLKAGGICVELRKPR